MDRVHPQGFEPSKNDEGGLFISLEEMEKKEAEQKLLKEEEEKQKKIQEEKDQLNFRRNEIAWAYNCYVLGSGPAGLALITVLVGPFIHKVGAKCKSKPLDVFVFLAILLAYIYLFLYTWLLMGPIPFRGKMRPVKIIFGMIAVFSLGVYGSGLSFFVTGSACFDEAPMQYRFCQMQLYFYLFAGGCTSIKFLREFLHRRGRLKRKLARLKLKQQLAEEADDDDDEEEEDGNEDEEEEGGDEDKKEEE